MKKQKREKLLINSDSQEIQVAQQTDKPLHRDYITLRNRPYKKISNDDQVFQSITSAKYQQYFSSLSSVKQLYNFNQGQLKQLSQIVQTGKNICIFGRGSKIQLLKSIYKKYLTHYNAIQIKGYLPSMSQKKISNSISNFLITKLNWGMNQKDKNNSNNTNNIIQSAKQIKQILLQHEKKIIVILHSIDGQNFLSPQSQQKISYLFDNPNIQLICSLDNIKIVMCWSPIVLQKLRLYFFNVDTKQPYIQELKYKPLKNQQRQTAQDSLIYIWRSLTKTQKQILKIIAENSLKNYGVDEKQTSFLSFNDLLQKCYQQMILANDNQLRQNLIQLVDHKVILERPDDRRNKKIYTMKYDKKIYQKVLQWKVD